MEQPQKPRAVVPVRITVGYVIGMILCMKNTGNTTDLQKILVELNESPNKFYEKWKNSYYLKMKKYF